MTSLYIGELRTENKHLKSGNELITDAPTDNNGKGEAFSPTDLVCAALSSCILTTMGIVAKRDSINIDGMTTEITKEMSASPRKISAIMISIHLDDLKIKQLSEKHKEILKRTAHSCPVALSLHPDIKQEISFNF